MAENKGKTVKIPAISPRTRPVEEAANYRAMHNVDFEGRLLTPEKLLQREAQSRPQETPHQKDSRKESYVVELKGELPKGQTAPANRRRARSEERSNKATGS